MDVLILHPNFPAQFRERAKWLVRNGHRVTFVCQTHYGRELKGVRRVTLKGDLGHDHLCSKKLSLADEMVYRSEQYHKGLGHLKSRGYTPEIVISHSGWGCSLYSGELWPYSTRIAYVEWWFGVNTSLPEFNKQCKWPIFHEKPQKSKIAQDRNHTTLREIQNSTRLVAPTHWQRIQLPQFLRQKCEVIYDGVDTDRFQPCQNSAPEKKVITYGTRGMEVTRGFPEFIRELPAILNRFPNVQVQIAGTDEINYGGKAPKEGSWGKWAVRYLDKHNVRDRVAFLGYVSKLDYVQWLQSSWVHVHFSQPYVASWSLLEAMACGCCIIASDVQPIREFLLADTGLLVDHRHTGCLLQPVIAVNQDPGLYQSLKHNARLRALQFPVELANERWRTAMSV